MADSLPYTEPELIRQCQTDYEEAALMGGQEAMDACFRLSWALVHSRSRSDVDKGVDLAEAMLHSSSLDRRDLQYLAAVGKYRSKKYLDARRILKAVLEEHPDFRQAATLLDAAESEIIKDGLVGVGAGAAVLGAVIGIVAAVARRR